VYVCDCCIKQCSVNIDVGKYFCVCRSRGSQAAMVVATILRVYSNIKSRLLLLLLLSSSSSSSSSLWKVVCHSHILLNFKYEKLLDNGTKTLFITKYQITFSPYFLPSPVSKLIPCLSTSNKYIRRLQHAVVPSLRNHVHSAFQWLRLIRCYWMAVNRSGREANRSVLGCADTKKETKSIRTHTTYSCLTA